MLLTHLVLTCIVGHVLSACPHEDVTLKRWSEAASWGAGGKPIQGDNVVLNEGFLLDEHVHVYNVTIGAGGRLVFDPRVELSVEFGNVFVDGVFQIGSEDCPYNGKLTITMTGNRESHDGEKEPKVILVRAGGTIDIHGEQRRSWTKLTSTLYPARHNDGIVYNHLSNDTNVSYRSWINGVAMYTFTLNNGVPVATRYGAYDLHYHRTDFINHIESVQDGDIVMLASQRAIRQHDNSDRLPESYNAFETLIYGEPTGNSLLRTVDPIGETWALIYQKGNKNSLVEMKNQKGKDSYARQEFGGYIFSSEAYGDLNHHRQVDNFRIGSMDDIFPKLQLVDDVTSWVPGNKIVVASTDYDLNQAEEFELTLCVPGDCAANEVRINDLVEYMHFGEVVKGAVDMRAEVALITRSVVIQGQMEPNCPVFNGNCDDFNIKDRDTFGAHIKILENYANVRIENVELRNVGQQTDAGRYPIHFHMCLDKIASADVPYVRGNSIHNTFARCVTIHGTHGVKLEDNTCYEHMGHGYFLEDGGEKNNVFNGNLAINTRKTTGNIEPVDRTRPASFWITNPLVTFTNNVAAGGEGTGIWFIYPDEPLGPSRPLGLMGVDEAKRTMITSIYNNVAHSQDNTGIMIGGRLMDNRKNMCCNKWQPLADPTNPDSEPQQIPLEHMTAYKNELFNIWIEGGLLDVSQLSVSDSANGMLVTNEGQQGKFGGKVSHSVVIGESANIGEPTNGFSRSLPKSHDSGVTMWKGPTKFSDIWFDSFNSNAVYDIAAIAKKRVSPYFFSVLNSFENVQFAFADDVNGGTYAISGDKDLPAWSQNKDGELLAGMTFIQPGPTPGENRRLYVVKPDPLSAAAADCKLRPNWRLAVSQTKYGNLRVFGDFTDRHAVFVRDDVPSAELEFEMKVNTGPQVVMDGSVTYTVHFPQGMPASLKFTVPGLDMGDKLRIGICTPLGAEINAKSFHPFSLNTVSKFTQVSTMAELDQDDDKDGQKFYHDAATGMVYYKFINTETRSPDESNTCNKRKCPEFRIEILSGDRMDADCRSRLYTTAQRSMAIPELPIYNETIAPTGNQLPPSNYGAGATLPFPGEAAVDGGWGDWSGWSTCSRTCDEGRHYRTRMCNNPLPRNGGASCVGDAVEVQPCLVKYCPINGELSQWSEWSTCANGDVDSDPSTCSGVQERARDCSSPPAQYGGRYCQGTVKEVRPCEGCA